MAGKISSNKLLASLERIFVLVRYFMWEKGKNYGLTPVQMQILQHLATLDTPFRKVSFIAREFHLTPPTVSEAVSTLLKKDLIERVPDPEDRRVYYLNLTPRGKELVEKLKSWNEPFEKAFKDVSEEEKKAFFSFFVHLAKSLHEKGYVQVVRLCVTCSHFEEGDKGNSYRCRLLNIPISVEDVKVNCNKYSVRA